MGELTLKSKSYSITSDDDEFEEWEYNTWEKELAHGE